MEQQILPELQAHLDGLLLMSESEAPLTAENMGQMSEKDLLDKLTAEHGETASVNVIPAADFFDKISRTADPNDQIVTANAERFQQLYTYLKEHTTEIEVIRVEGEVQVPVIITALQADGSRLALSTYAVES